MIKDTDLKVDISVVSKLPKLEKELKGTDEEIAVLHKALKKTGKNAQLGKDLQVQEKEKAKLLAQIEAVETALFDDLKQCAARHKLIGDELDALEKRKDLPASVASDLKKLRAIHSGTRTKDLAYLAGVAKKKGLRVEPAKIKGVAEDLNGDVKDVNAVAARIDEEIRQVHVARWKELEKQLSAALKVLPTGSATLNKYFKDSEKKGFADFDKALLAAKAEIASQLAEFQRLNGINELRTAFPTLKGSVVYDIIEKGRKSTDSVATVKQKLQDALDAQRKPSKSQWVQFLNMASYQVVKVNKKYDNIGIHITFDNNSWSAAAKNGTIDVSKGTPEELLEKLFGDVEWSYQAHATLELEYAPKKYPHVYWGGDANHWNDIKTKHGKDDAWIKGAKDALSAVLVSKKKELLALVKKAKDLDGMI